MHAQWRAHGMDREFGECGAINAAATARRDPILWVTVQ